LKGGSLSPVDVGIVWDRLITISDEVFNTIVRTAFSVVVRESRDACVVIMDAEGRSIAQSSQSLPGFLGVVPTTTRHMLCKFPKNKISPGDVLATNDPWMGPGQLNDIVIVTPIFAEGEIVSFAGTVSHLPDIGGAGYSASSREVYEEGLNIPVSKIMVEGEINDQVFDFIQSNVRMQDQVTGDIKAAISAGRVCTKRIEGLVEALTFSGFEEICREILGRSKSLVLKKISEMPRGVYEDTICLESNSSTVRINCRISIEESGIMVDFAGTSPQVAEAINVPLTFTAAWTCYAVKSAISPTIPNNQASSDLVTISAPEGSILNAKRPAPVAARHLVGHLLPPVVFGALSKPIPSQVMADSAGFSVVYFYGKNPRGEEYAVELDTNGGLGATFNSDGRSTRGFPTLAPNIPIEVWEYETGLLFESKRLRPDSGGAGESQGGQGQIVEIRNRSTQPVVASVTISKTQFPARGFLDGKDGAVKAVFIDGSIIHPRRNHILNPNQVLRIEDGGGGGFGPPSRRDTARIEEDLTNGIISSKFAEEKYNYFGRNRSIRF